MNINRLILNSAVAQGLDVIGDRWALRILNEAFNGKRRFEEFRTHTGASRATLTRRLTALVDNDILYKRPYSTGSTRFEYKFTEKGLGLFGASLLARQWETDWSAKDLSKIQNLLFHSRCDSPLHPKAVCRHCHEPLELEDVSWLSLNEELSNQLDEIKSIHQHRRVRTGAESIGTSPDVKLADLVGDRWTLLILIVAFFGTTRYDDFLKQLKIAPGILVERLKTLIEAGVLHRKSYQSNPPRYAYKLTAKGKSLYPFTMSLRQWAIDWLPDKVSEPNLIHTTCGAPLAVDIHCESCGQKPWPRDVRLQP